MRARCRWPARLSRQAHAEPGSACAASTAAALLARPGAVPRLLALAGREGEAGALATSLQAAAPAVRLPPVALLDDLSSTLRLVCAHWAAVDAPFSAHRSVGSHGDCMPGI